MRLSKNIISLIISAVMLVNIYSFGAIQAFAHNEMLDVVYDACIGDDEADSIDEMWYALIKGPYCYHLSNDKPPHKKGLLRKSSP